MAGLPRSRLHGAESLASSSRLSYPTPGDLRRELRRLEEHAGNAFLAVFWRMVKPRGTSQHHQRQRALEGLRAEAQTFRAALLRYASTDVAAAVRGLLPAMPRPLRAKVEVPVPPAGAGGRRPGLAPEEMARLEAMARAAVFDVGLGLQATWMESVVAALPPLSTGAEGAVWAAITGPAAELERRLLPAVTELALASERLADESRAELATWLRLVRLCIAAALLAGIPYRKVWGEPFRARWKGQVIEEGEGIYGTAGHWLSVQVQDLAMALLESTAYAELAESVRGVDWLRSAATVDPGARDLDPFPLGRTLQALAFEPGIWRSWASLHPRVDPPSAPCRPTVVRAAKGDVSVGPDERGVAGPYEFPPIPRELWNPGQRDLDRGADQGDHLFASPHGIARASLVKRAWDAWRAQHRQLAARPAPEPDEAGLEFRITAGTLRYGGAHPPHLGHRNGAHFDIVVRSVLPLRCKNERVMLPGAEGGMDVVSEIPGPGNTLFLIFEPADATQPPPKPVKICPSFVYPPVRVTHLVDGGEKAIPPEDVGMKLTQCMLLSFPSQILFADWTTLSRAQNQLRARVSALLARQPSAEERSAAQRLLDCLPAAPAAEPELSFGALVPRDDHHDHWHVSYVPHDLEAPPPRTPEALRWIEAHLGELLSG